MPPDLLRALLFEALGLYSAWSIVNDLRTGVYVNRRFVIDVRENPGGFYLMQLVKAGFVCFATAVLLNALGLIGDPFVWLKQTLPFLAPR